MNIKSVLSNRKALLYFIGSVLVIAFFSCLPGFKPEKFVATHYNIAGDLWVHAMGYFCMSTLAMILFFEKKEWVYLNSIFLLVFSTLIEFSQIYIPGREFSWLDILSNFVGIFLAMLLAFIFYGIKRHSKIL